jgi:hypothetical protein
MGVQIGGLQVRKRNGRSYRVLRYSIRMQLKEVGTKYWIKAWSLNSKRMDTAVPIDSKKLDCESIFDTHEISQNLSRSFELGSGVENPPSHLPERFPNFIPQPQSSHEVQRRPSFSPLSLERPNEQLRPVERQQLGSSAHPRPPLHAEGSHVLQQQLKEGQVRPHAAASELSLLARNANAVLAHLGRKKTAPSEEARTTRHSRPSKIPLPRVAPRQSADSGIESAEDGALKIGSKSHKPVRPMWSQVLTLIKLAIAAGFERRLAQRNCLSARNVSISAFPVNGSALAGGATLSWRVFNER